MNNMENPSQEILEQLITKKPYNIWKKFIFLIFFLKKGQKY